MLKSETPLEYSITFDSVRELARVGLTHLDKYLAERSFSQRKGWFDVKSKGELEKLGAEGWEVEAAEAMDIAQKAVDEVEREYDMPAFHPIWDVAGCEVDVARYLANEPENMIDYEIVPTTRAGRVIVLCASISYSSAITNETIKKRGHGMAALAFALNKLGFATEIWADLSATEKINNKERRMNMRVLVKGPNDAIDPATIMFAFSHPAMLRAFGLSAMYEMPEDWRKALGVVPHGGHGTPTSPKEDLSEEAIYLPEIRSNHDVPEAHDLLIGHLKLLGIVEDA